MANDGERPAHMEAESQQLLESDEESVGIERSEEDGLRRYRAPLVVERLKAPPLMLWGSLGMAMACLAVYSVVLAVYFSETNEEYKFRYASGQGYMASLFADFTWRRSTVAGRVFVTCSLMSAFTIQSSWYVSALRNVFTGVERLRFGERYLFRWSSIRQIVPTVGLLLMVGVSQPPRAVWNQSPGYSGLAGVVVHSIGGWAVFLGYTLAELQCLEYLQFVTGVDPKEATRNGHGNNDENRYKKRRTRPHLDHRLELPLRSYCIAVSCFCAVFFIICQAALFGLELGCPGFPESPGENKYVGGHCDEWVFEGECIVIADDDVAQKVNCTEKDKWDKLRLVVIDSEAEVINTASGWIFVVKCISLLCEFVGTMSFCVSHLLIWYFCEERHFHRYWLHDCKSICPHAKKLRAIDTALRAIVEHAPCNSRAQIGSKFKWEAFKVVSMDDEVDDEVKQVLARFDLSFGQSEVPVRKKCEDIKWNELEQELEELRAKYAHAYSNEVPKSSSGAPSSLPPPDPAE